MDSLQQRIFVSEAASVAIQHEQPLNLVARGEQFYRKSEKLMNNKYLAVFLNGTQKLVLAAIVGLLSVGCAESSGPEEATATMTQTNEAATDMPHPPASAAYSADGVLIQYDDRGAGDLAVVLVHGWNCDKSYWQLQRDLLAQKYRVVSVDLAGHGESGVDRDSWSIPGFGDDVVAVVDALQLDQVVLVGHSMGGSVILDAGLKLGDRVRELVVVDALREPDKAMPSAMISATLDNMKADYSATVTSIVQGMFVDDSPARVRDFVIRDMSSSPPLVGTGALLALAAYDPMQALERLDVPLTLINSDYQPTSLGIFERTVADFEYIEMAGVGHFVMLEDPDRFTGLLASAIAD